MDEIEVVNPQIERGRIGHALLDFDGTVSLIREGWQGVMVPYMVEVLQATGTAETGEQLTRVVRDYVDLLTGKQTIYQMIRLAEEVERRGGRPEDPLVYKHEYLDRLWERIKNRVARLKAGQVTPDELAVPGSLEMVRDLHARGVRLYLASGTDQPYVLDEAEALGVTPYFEGGVWGAVDNYRTFSKAMVIDRIIRQNGLEGPEFVAFGDGYVEIENAKAVGGIAVGVATNEAERCGMDEWKRERLKRAGADLIIPDFRCREALLRYLFAEGE